MALKEYPDIVLADETTPRLEFSPTTVHRRRRLLQGVHRSRGYHRSTVTSAMKTQPLPAHRGVYPCAMQFPARYNYGARDEWDETELVDAPEDVGGYR